MFKYKAEIVCDKCGYSIWNESDNKKDLASIRELKEIAREQGWVANRYKCLCDCCKNHIMRPEHYMG